MTPKMQGALDALRQMQHHADTQAEKLTHRIMNETMGKLSEGFKKAHGNVDKMETLADDIDKFADQLGNGAPLDSSEPLSDGPRSSEVAQK